jgi:hypothetical protein
MESIPRRRFLRRAGGLAGAALLSPWAAADPPRGRPKVAAVFTEFRYRSHAHDLLENFLEPYLFNGRWHDPAVEVASFYADQFPEKDMARAVARDYKIPLYRTIAEALCLGGKDLAVDAVLSIGEHGDYPVNAKGSASTRASASSTRPSPSSGRAAGPCRCSTTSICPTAGTGRRRCTTPRRR